MSDAAKRGAAKSGTTKPGATKSGAAKPGAAKPGAAGRRILVIDDTHLVRLYYRDALERAGFTVEEALNGLEALEKLLAAPADLLIVDVNMPKMDGFTFLNALRRRDLPMAAIPALVTTTEAASQDADAARAAGANFFLVKPVAQDTLVDYVRMLCGVPA